MASYHDIYPREDGPPAVLAGSGDKIFKNTNGSYTVVLDHGAMRAVWELVEAEAKRRFPTHKMSSTDALLRGVGSLREAYWAENEKPVQKKPTGRVLPTNFQRKKAGTAASDARAKVKRVRKSAPTEIEARPEVPARSVRRIRPR